MWKVLLCTYNNILKNCDVLIYCFRCFVVGIGLAPLIGARPYLKKHVLSVLCNEVKWEQNILAIQNVCLEPTFFYHAATLAINQLCVHTIFTSMKYQILFMREKLEVYINHMYVHYTRFKQSVTIVHGLFFKLKWWGIKGHSITTWTERRNGGYIVFASTTIYWRKLRD